MGKMTSLLEKYKLIEKEEFDSSLLDTPSADEVSEEKESVETPSVAAPQSASKPVEANQNHLKSTPQHTMSSQKNTSVKPTVAEVSQKVTSDNQISQPNAYTKLLNINQVYEYLKLDDVAATSTVFLLENLIKALPAELPEFVKKTTVDNIIQASAMDLPKLLEDGRLRLDSISKFSTDYTRINSEEIASLKAEIAKLTAIIAEYHQQIKHRETLIAEETNLIQAEQQRIQSIMEFFNN